MKLRKLKILRTDKKGNVLFSYIKIQSYQYLCFTYASQNIFTAKKEYGVQCKTLHGNWQAYLSTESSIVKLCDVLRNFLECS